MGSNSLALLTRGNTGLLIFSCLARNITQVQFFCQYWLDGKNVGRGEKDTYIQKMYLQKDTALRSVGRLVGAVGSPPTRPNTRIWWFSGSNLRVPRVRSQRGLFCVILC